MKNLWLTLGNDRICGPGEAHTIAVSPRDEVFVADTLNYRVQKRVRRISEA